MSNPYSPGALAQRWTVGQATTISRLNISRIRGDYNTWALDQIMDPAEAQDGLLAGVADVGQGDSAIGVDITAMATENASKVILVDLTDPATMWDVSTFLARVRFTSWYQELGAPPMRGAMWVTNDGDDVVWWDLDGDVQYMKFTASSTNLLDYASGTIGGLFFLDGKIWIAEVATGLFEVDLLRDHTLKFGTSGLFKSTEDISDRNSGTFSYIGHDSALALNSNVCYAVGATRHDNLTDEYGRPKHFWAVGTTDEIGLYNPDDDAIYDSSLGATATIDHLVFAGNYLHFQLNDGSSDWWSFQAYATVSADAWSHLGQFYPTANGTEWNIPLSSPAAGTGVAPLVHPFFDMMMVSASGECLLWITYDAASGHAGLIKVTSTYNSPYMKGTRAGIYPLHDVNDVGGASNTLTNNNTVTFTAGVFGNAATFDGVNQYLSRVTDSDFNLDLDDWTVSCYVKSGETSNPAALEDIVLLNSATDKVRIQFNTSGQLYAFVTDDNEVTVDALTSSGDFYDNKWHHVALVCNRTDGNFYLWCDGSIVATAAISNAAATLNAVQDIYVSSTAYPFYGQIDQLSINKAAFNEYEVRMEYQRMVRALGGATHTLGASDVDSIRTDLNSGLMAVCVADQLEVWDAVLALRESIDAVTTATLNDADVRLPPGADDPWYIMGRSGKIDVVAPDRRVLV